MDRSEDDTMLVELRELRPTPRPEFTAELDERAAAGFPRRSTRAPKSPFARLVDRRRTMTPRRRLIPALGLALTAVVVATVVIASTEGSGSGGVAMMTSGLEHSPPASAEEVGSSIKGAGAAVKGTENGPARGGYIQATQNVAPVTLASRRDIERSAAIVLGTKPDEVAGAAARVYKAVHEVNGVVLRSSVESGRTGPTGASFSLLIPSRKLDDALASFSQIAEVRSRHDATDDITAPTVGVTEELRDSNASIEGLLKELGDVETESERESVEARLREERRRHAAIRASLDHLHKRASMSEVSVRIVTDHGAGVTPGGSRSGSWGVGDALHDAGHILTIAAGVVLIGLAVLAPIALVLLLVWLGNRFRVRRLRERTLG